MREIEFEFDEGGGGEFKPTGNVVKVIRDYLAQGELDRATSLLASSTAEIGDKLIEDAQIGASQELWKNLALLFSTARDMQRAAACANEIGDDLGAARFYEGAYQWEQAATAYRKAGDLPQAAKMYENDLAYDKAAKLYMEAGDHKQAAVCFARAGAYYHAGHLFMKMGAWKEAVEVLQRVERMQRYYAESSVLLGKFFDKQGNERAAMERYMEVVRARPLDEATLEVHHRLAGMMTDAGHVNHAEKLWEGVLKLDPTHDGAKTGIDQIEQVRLTALPPAPPPEAPAPKKATPQSPPPSPVKVAPAAPAKVTPTAASAGAPPPLILPGDDPPAAPPENKVVPIHDGFDVLRGLPIFSDLSLDELRGFHALSNRVTFEPGKLLIEQGQPGEALYVVVSGKVSVEIIVEGKAPMEVARLGQGASLGEMSMVDQAPASARVTALEKVAAFRFPLDTMLAHMVTDPRAGMKVMRVLGRILSTRLREANAALAGK